MASNNTIAYNVFLGTIFALFILFLTPFASGANLSKSNTPHDVEKHPFIQLENVFADHTIRMERTAKTYIQALDQSRWDTLFHTDRIRDDIDLQESLSIIRKVKNIIHNTKSQNSVNLQLAKKDVEQLQISPEYKHAAIDGLDDGVKYIEELLDLALEKANEQENLFKMMEANKSWNLRNNSILFQNAAEQQQADYYLNRIEEISIELIRKSELSESERPR